MGAGTVLRTCVQTLAHVSNTDACRLCGGHDTNGMSVQSLHSFIVSGRHIARAGVLVELALGVWGIRKPADSKNWQQPLWASPRRKTPTKISL